MCEAELDEKMKMGLTDSTFMVVFFSKLCNIFYISDKHNLNIIGWDSESGSTLNTSCNLTVTLGEMLEPPVVQFYLLIGQIWVSSSERSCALAT